MLDIWLRESSDQVRYTVISSYLRATWIVEICRAIAGLNRERRFATYSEELADLNPIAESVWAWTPAVLKIRPIGPADVISLQDVDRLGRAVMKYLRSAAAIELPSPEDALDQLDLLEMASITSQVFGALASLVSRLGGHEAWTFRICMDEGEFLSEDWAVAVRTLIRETDAPVYLAVSVLHSLGTTTRADGVSLSIDDREIVDLDDRTAEDMISLLNGVLRARMEVVGLDRSSFDLKQFLGNPDLNELLEIAVSRSETREAERFRRRYADKSADPIRDHLLANDAIRSGEVLSRREESAGYRKKKIAGYLNLLGSIGVDRPTYAGWRIAVNMADNSVRDFIRFLRYAMEIGNRSEPELATNRDVARFLSLRQIDFRTQDGALDRLGRRKLESMSATLVDHFAASAVIRLFGEVSHRGDFYLSGRMGKPNANRIVIRDPGRSLEPRASFGAFLSLLRDAASYGYIADLSIVDGRVTCRVNRSFARHFGFSYWKPQYETSVSFKLVERAIEDPDAPPSRWLEPVAARRLTRNQAALPGFEDWAEGGS